MSETISVRISRRLKEDLENLRIDYAELVRQYLEEVVRREKKRLMLTDADRTREELRAKYGLLSPSSHLVREDRDEDSR
ncbi:putative antitoxin VapB3 [Metallosphaera sp. J1]|uniref:antitoxin n=1 Tax=Metallosphaera TaxID=41980 RepID=UPI001EDDBAE5|nr:antitoxin [Metallosphaera javensis (ex Hofmann et al. 2022)]MCG3109077.1 putative antitoxin VapB3 [Metallosphaera javensis (ex Hofmann et al. 2022)]BCS93606.1 MAG: putative antitoxin VapB3 [Metallosphaera javensis (ex Sakai et al. 2022)]